MPADESAAAANDCCLGLHDVRSFKRPSFHGTNTGEAGIAVAGPIVRSTRQL
jgi:hypothetical protein